MISVRPLLFRAMYPRRHTGKKVGTCGALPRHGRFSATQTARAPRLTPLNFSHRTEQLLGRPRCPVKSEPGAVLPFGDGT
jgi:hypothetical protein